MKPLASRATSNTNSPTSNMMNIKLQTESLITSVPTIQYILLLLLLLLLLSRFSRVRLCATP